MSLRLRRAGVSLDRTRAARARAGARETDCGPGQALRALPRRGTRRTTGAVQRGRSPRRDRGSRHGADGRYHNRDRRPRTPATAAHAIPCRPTCRACASNTTYRGARRSAPAAVDSRESARRRASSSTSCPRRCACCSMCAARTPEWRARRPSPPRHCRRSRFPKTTRSPDY